MVQNILIFSFHLSQWCLQICFIFPDKNRIPSLWMRWAFSLLITKLRQAFLLMKMCIRKECQFSCLQWSILFILTFLLVYNCFTTLCNFLLCSVNQLYISLPLEPPFPPPDPTHLGHLRAPCALQQLPLAVYFKTSGSVYALCHSLNSSHPPLLPRPVSTGPLCTPVSLILPCKWFNLY